MNCMVNLVVGASGGGGVIWMSYDPQYVQFKPNVTVASMGTTCAGQ
jgi:hypothetical protein